MKVCNTAAYNNSLKRRGNIFSILDKAIEFWWHCDVTGTTKSKYTYSDMLINLAGCLRYLLKLRFRQLEGFLESYITCRNLEEFSAPDYTTLCRRMNKKQMIFKDHRTEQQRTNDRHVSLAIDSSGINIYATGGGHSKKNAEKRKHEHYAQVRKLHVMLDLESGDVVDMEMSVGAASDHKSGQDLVGNYDKSIRSVYADRAYDRESFRHVCYKKCAKQIIPPLSNARTRRPIKQQPPGLWDDRNAAVKMMKASTSKDEGLKQWKNQNCYGKRSRIESYFHRFKTTFSFYFMSKSEIARHNELVFKSLILNAFNQLPKPIFQIIN